MAERNARFTLCALEVVGDGVGFENSARGWEGLEEAWVGLLDLIVVIFVVSPVRDFIFLLFFFVGSFSFFFRFENVLL